MAGGRSIITTIAAQLVGSIRPLAIIVLILNHPAEFIAGYVECFQRASFKHRTIRLFPRSNDLRRLHPVNLKAEAGLDRRR